MKKRLDQVLAQLNPQWSRSQIQSLIHNQKVSLLLNGKWQLVVKPGYKVDETENLGDLIKIEKHEILDYVSRGALKLKGAFDHFQLNASGVLALDVGLSTGGFSDFLLQGGASRILGVDVGQGQLHARLKEDDRLQWFDKINMKEPLSPDILQKFFHGQDTGFDLVVIDVSFISLEKIIPNIAPLLKTTGKVVALVKPQFELTRSDLNKKGVVKDPELYPQVMKKINGVFSQNQLQPIGYCESPIEGDDGNKEFLLLATCSNDDTRGGL